MKKIAVLLVALLVAFGSAQETQTLTVSGFPNLTDALAPIIELYMEENPNVEVELEVREFRKRSDPQAWIVKVSLRAVKRLDRSVVAAVALGGEVRSIRWLILTAGSIWLEGNMVRKLSCSTEFRVTCAGQSHSG